MREYVWSLGQFIRLYPILSFATVYHQPLFGTIFLLVVFLVSKTIESKFRLRKHATILTDFQALTFAAAFALMAEPSASKFFLLFIPVEMAVTICLKNLFSHLEQDYFSKCANFVLFTVVWSLSHKEPFSQWFWYYFTFIAAYMAFVFISIWFTQIYIFRYHFRDAVIVLHTAASLSSADSAHFWVKAGRKRCHINFEGRSDNGRMVLLVEDIRDDAMADLLRTHPRDLFFIPFNSYGLLGLMDAGDQLEIERHFSEVVKSYPKYSYSNRSCHEIAFNFAQKLVTPQSRIWISLTALKGAGTVFALYAVPLLILMRLNLKIEFGYR